MSGTGLSAFARQHIEHLRVEFEEEVANAGRHFGSSAAQKKERGKHIKRASELAAILYELRYGTLTHDILKEIRS